jgi:hypothetical protein
VKRPEPDYAALAVSACRNAPPVSPATVEYLASIFGPAREALLKAAAEESLIEVKQAA